MNLRLAAAEDAEQMAALHGTAFDAGWPLEVMGELLAAPGVMALLVEDEAVQAMVLWRCAADEAEILTIAVDPRRRRGGLGALLVAAAADFARAHGAAAMFLEVAVDNAAAIGLYTRAGFLEVGRRRGYYARGEVRVDALVLRRDLNSPPGTPYP